MTKALELLELRAGPHDTGFQTPKDIMKIITPTIGRKVWFYPNGLKLTTAGPLDVFAENQALDATIVCVYSDRMVNLSVTDHGGRVHSVRSCTLRQEGDDVPGGSYCEWMPYQIGQAKTSEAKPAPVIAGTGAAPIGLTPADIEAAIAGTDYHVFPGTTVTVCMLTLRNGAKTIGYNYGPIDPARQDWEQGKKAAHAMAVEKVWELEGYLLRERLHQAAAGQ